MNYQLWEKWETHVEKSAFFALHAKMRVKCDDDDDDNNHHNRTEINDGHDDSTFLQYLGKNPPSIWFLQVSCQKVMIDCHHFFSFQIAAMRSIFLVNGVNFFRPIRAEMTLTFSLQVDFCPKTNPTSPC